MDIYSDHLNKDTEVLLRTKTYKQYCALNKWIDYDRTKDGWIKGLYDTIKAHPHRYWSKSLPFPKADKWSDLFLDVVIATEKPSYEYYSLTTHRTPFDYNSHLDSRFYVSDRGANTIGSGKFYHLYVKPKCTVRKFFNANLIEGLGGFDIVKQGDTDTYLIIANSAAHIGSWWAALLKTDEANPLTRLSTSDTQRIADADERKAEGFAA